MSDLMIDARELLKKMQEMYLEHREAHRELCKARGDFAQGLYHNGAGETLQELRNWLEDTYPELMNKEM